MSNIKTKIAKYRKESTEFIKRNKGDILAAGSCVLSLVALASAMNNSKSDNTDEDKLNSVDEQEQLTLNANFEDNGEPVNDGEMWSFET